ncbi:MAG: glycosyltransferase [Bacteroidetes bacterium]|nr:glycosyltransferase [Bacteroidota bacterium]
MKFAIITHVDHFYKNDNYYAYAPYVREMNIWGKFVDKIVIVAPVSQNETSYIHIPYSHKNITISKIPPISLSSIFEVLKAFLMFPVIACKIFMAMQKADHIHLRCPGNIGLIGCLIQVLFPKKPKTAKYAGNWDPNAKQPMSYRFQKWLLSNTFFTKNMQVMVYGEWPDQSKNIKSFFTASYSRKKVRSIQSKEFNFPLRFIFVGNLTPGKRPLYAIQLVEYLNERGIDCRFDVYGDGVERNKLEKYIEENQISEFIQLHEIQTAEKVEEIYKKSDFLLLPSKSEGWPKVVAEAMFWGVIPIVTKISCVPWMLGMGKRGILIESNLENDVDTLAKQIRNLDLLNEMSIKAQKWSHQYTLDDFEIEIKKLL